MFICVFIYVYIYIYTCYIFVMTIYPVASSSKPPSWAQTLGSEVMNAPAPPLIAPDSVRERLVDIMNNVFTLVVWLGWSKTRKTLKKNNQFKEQAEWFKVAAPRGIQLQIDTKSLQYICLLPFARYGFERFGMGFLLFCWRTRYV